MSLSWPIQFKIEHITHSFWHNLHNAIEPYDIDQASIDTLEKTKKDLYNRTNRKSYEFTEQYRSTTSNNKMCSQFDCKLTPSKTELLIMGYSKLFAYTFIPTDIIWFFIAYFNQIIYFKHKKCDISLNYIINSDLIFKITRRNWGFFSLKLLNKMRSVTNIIIRIRLFCVQYFVETHEIIQISGATPIELRMKHGKWSNSDIGIEIETLHIEWNNGNIWSKWSYPWTNNLNDMQLFTNDNWFREHFNSYCFGVNGKYYLAKEPTLKYYTKCRSLSQFNNIMMRTTFNDMVGINDYIPLTFMRLTSFVIVQKNKIKEIILSINNELEQLELMKHKSVSELITKYAQFRHELASLLYPILVHNIQKTKKSLCMKKPKNIYSQHKKKAIKDHRTYMNNKRKHKYNRW
eukprot:474366_1